MVMSFRVSDLQTLLGFVGRSKSGLKHELVTRALQLVQFDCSPELFKKIKEIYETRYAKPSDLVQTPAPPPQHRPLPEALSLHSSYDRSNAVARTAISTPNIDYPALYGKYLNGLGRLPVKPVKPEVRLVKLPFYTILDELLKPTELGELSGYVASFVGLQVGGNEKSGWRSPWLCVVVGPCNMLDRGQTGSVDHRLPFGHVQFYSSA